MRKQELHPRTAIINRKQRIQSKSSRNQALRWLSEKFPEAFDNSVRIQPLKKGIMNDILAFSEEAQNAGISKSKLRQAVVLFTRRVDYLIALKVREVRIDLYGKSTGIVSEEEAEKAAMKIKKRVEKSAKNAKKIPSPKVTNHTAPPDHIYSDHFKTNPQSRQITTAYCSSSSEGGHISKKEDTSNTLTSNVFIKRKPARNYDPEAVARLKEKLGLSRKKQATE